MAGTAADRVLVNRYALKAPLGRGGMVVVWRAHDTVLGREVAVKEVTFPVDVTAEEREVLVQRTLREARAAARLDHPRVTRVYDVVHEGGKPWLIMEHVPSRSLQDIVEEVTNGERRKIKLHPMSLYAQSDGDIYIDVEADTDLDFWAFR